MPQVLGALLAAAIAAAGCRRTQDSTITLPPGTTPVANRGSDPPVALDAESPVEYPPALYQQGISATVLLRLFVDETGRQVPDSIRIQSSSGYPALDSAALVAAPRLRYAPALHNGMAVATLFTQPVMFRHPDRGGVTP
ncbi:MAG TPA: energy transducer TonB [Gemmatimonadales bacterium]|nr:energy transducer TonB [Gemmatimonadales bacterium]